MKAVWKGSIAFGLVNIPIKLYSAVEPKVMGFRLLCGKCNTPIKYKRYCHSCKKEIEWSHIVRGIEIKKGEFYVIKPEEIKKLKPLKTDTIDIVEFTTMGQIDPIYFEKHYFVVPEKVNEKAYFLFKDVLLLTARVAIGRMVMREKEYTVVLAPYKKGILLSTLNYLYEVRDINKVDELQKEPKLSKEEIKLAKDLLNKMYEKEFDITEFKDTFAEKLKKIIKKKMEGKKVVIKVEKAKAIPEKNLMKALKASVGKSTK